MPDPSHHVLSRRHRSAHAGLAPTQPARTRGIARPTNAAPAKGRRPPTRRTSRGRSRLQVADLFAGMGGFHLAFHRAGAQVVFAAENDPAARQTYEANFAPLTPELFNGSQFATDVRAVDLDSVPAFDVLCAGFPCQPFSLVGKRRGFDDPRGTLFFEIVRFLEAKRPRAFFLENVRGLLSHDKGRTIKVIERSLTKQLGYSFHLRVVKAYEFGLPQLRARAFMVGFADPMTPFAFPEPVPLEMSMDDVFGGSCHRAIGRTIMASGRGQRYGRPHAWDAYLVDGSVRRVGVHEALQMQGFPADFKFPVPEREAMKQLGNSVAVPAVEATARAIVTSLGTARSEPKLTPPKRMLTNS
ncbi:DNA (cytosine-5)-methyltransferase 1 [Frankineae bacterium MT45]|nr:DNA (cytosine-5)-methyltransferase 1 [Frankineae bacterium MT45]